MYMMYYKYTDNKYTIKKHIKVIQQITLTY